MSTGRASSTAGSSAAGGGHAVLPGVRGVLPRVGGALGHLAGGGGPAAWCRDTARLTRSVDVLDARVGAVCAAAHAPPRLAEGPMLGRTLAECVGGPGDGAGVPDPVGRRERWRHSGDDDDGGARPGRGSSGVVGGWSEDPFGLGRRGGAPGGPAGSGRWTPAADPVARNTDARNPDAGAPVPQRPGAGAGRTPNHLGQLPPPDACPPAARLRELAEPGDADRRSRPPRPAGQAPRPVHPPHPRPAADTSARPGAAASQLPPPDAGLDHVLERVRAGLGAAGLGALADPASTARRPLRRASAEDALALTASLTRGAGQWRNAWNGTGFGEPGPAVGPARERRDARRTSGDVDRPSTSAVGPTEAGRPGAPLAGWPTPDGRDAAPHARTAAHGLDPRTEFAIAPARPARLVRLAGDAEETEGGEHGWPATWPAGPATASESSAAPGVGGSVPATSVPELERLVARMLTDAARRHGIEA
ncbi:hypothetical protein [Occultella gossypii]|uniref:Uncharacterized protein n=1 Tax=Occultella gossypii TaxID=2800820 RepID=A0ABS7SHX3_9MICO|nr:hypothetical protein [Occultella gossypii]MBZ2199662.1 hypothetical protein [Occultella gossypii]